MLTFANRRLVRFTAFKHSKIVFLRFKPSFLEFIRPLHVLYPNNYFELVYSWAFF